MKSSKCCNRQKGTSRPSKRAKVLLSLFAFYGLRTSEAVRLLITDFEEVPIKLRLLAYTNVP